MISPMNNTSAQLNAASVAIGVSMSLVASLASQGSGTPLGQTLLNQAVTAIQVAINAITQIQIAASDLFKSSFGLDLQNIQAELQLALAQLSVPLPDVTGDAASVTSALDAAFKLITSLQGKLSQTAAARVAAFDLIPPDDIGGIDQLESFLNDVRIILGLPTVRRPRCLRHRRKTTTRISTSSS